MKWQRSCKWIQVVTHRNSWALRKVEVVLSSTLASDNVSRTRHPLPDYCDFVQQKHPLESLFKNCDLPQVTHRSLVTFDPRALAHQTLLAGSSPQPVRYFLSVPFSLYYISHYLILLSFLHIGKCLKVTINVFLYYSTTFTSNAKKKYLFILELTWFTRLGSEQNRDASYVLVVTSCIRHRQDPTPPHVVTVEASRYYHRIVFLTWRHDDSRNLMFLKIYFVCV